VGSATEPSTPAPEGRENLASSSPSSAKVRSHKHAADTPKTEHVLKMAVGALLASEGPWVPAGSGGDPVQAFYR